MNEGLATRFEAFELDEGNRPVFTPEQNYLRRNNLRQALQTDNLAPLRDILATHAGVEVHKQPRHVRSYYAHVWSLVLFLMEPSRVNPYHDGFQQLLAEVGTGDMERKIRAYLAADTDGRMSSGEAVFRAYITEDLETFEEDYRQFLYRLLEMET